MGQVWLWARYGDDGLEYVRLDTGRYLPSANFIEEEQDLSKDISRRDRGEPFVRNV